LCCFDVDQSFTAYPPGFLTIPLAGMKSTLQKCRAVSQQGLYSLKAVNLGVDATSITSSMPQSRTQFLRLEVPVFDHNYLLFRFLETT
jgi:hypothetical protein